MEGKLSNTMLSRLRSGCSIPNRAGNSPLCTRVPPHVQLDQWTSLSFTTELIARGLALELVGSRQSRLADEETIALCLPDRLAAGPSEAFIDDHEFCHLHPTPYGPIHLTLPPHLAAPLVNAGWGEQHLMAKAGLIASTVFLIYVPRDGGRARSGSGNHQNVTPVRTRRSRQPMSRISGSCIWDLLPSRIPLADALVSTLGNGCVCDGRLDNRQELTALLALPFRASVTAIALAVYEKFGETGFARLIGDFSVAIWDAKRRCLILASDYAGTRPLYYSADRSRALVSSSLRNLTAQLQDFEVDENFVAGFLSCGFAAGFTVYKGIKSVAPGKCGDYLARPDGSHPVLGSCRLGKS